MDLVYLTIFAFAAGFVDAVIGGGGLIQLPALFLFMPAGTPPAAVLGTNKFSSVCGTTVALHQFSRRVSIPMRIVGPTAGAALVFSFAGARIATILRPELIKPLIFCLLIVVLVVSWRRRDSKVAGTPVIAQGREVWWGAAMGAGIGFYDGFFGPGTGMWLVFGFVMLFGLDFLEASASAKAINFVTNIGALIFFLGNGDVVWNYAVPMGISNAAGAVVGSRLAMLKGNAFVRKAFFAVILVLLGRFGWELWSGA